MDENSRTRSVDGKSWAMRCGLALLLGLTMNCWGCGYSIISPPARFGLAELSAAPRRGQVELSAATGMHRMRGVTHTPAHFLGSASYGVTDRLMVQVDATFVWVGEADFPPNVGSQSFGAARVGLGYSPRTTRQWLRVTAGFGGGEGRVGPFVSPDIGFNAAWDNPYVVPFVNASVWLSAPTDVSMIVVPAGRPTSDDATLEDINGYLDQVNRFGDAELPTQNVVGRSFSAGVAIRLANHAANRSVNWAAGENATGPALLLALQVHVAGTREAGAGSVGVGVGFRHRF